MAQELVETTSKLVGGRTINVMDLNAVIIASTEKERIGNCHEGARQVIATGKAVAISRSQLSRYPGAKEGYNMPIYNKENLLGVVGIFGEPSEIITIAPLLEVYVAKCFQLEAMMNQRLIHGELRSSLLQMLLSLSPNDMDRVESLLNALQIQLTPPFCAIVLSVSSSATEEEAHIRMASLVEKLLNINLLYPRQDIWGMANGQLVIIKSDMTSRNSLFCEQLKTLTSGESGYVCMGKPCHKIEDIRHSYREAAFLEKHLPEGFYDILDKKIQCQYMLCKTAYENELFVSSLYERLSSQLRPQELEELLHSLECYYQEDHRVAYAAEKLFIHKNTLQYRLKRILDLLDITELPVFYQEYLIRMIIQHHKCHHSSKAKYH